MRRNRQQLRDMRRMPETEREDGIPESDEDAAACLLNEGGSLENFDEDFRYDDSGE